MASSLSVNYNGESRAIPGFVIEIEALFDEQKNLEQMADLGQIIFNESSLRLDQCTSIFRQ